MSLAATTGPTPRNGAQDLRQAIELPIASDVTLDRVFNGVKAWGERDDEGHALAIERVVSRLMRHPSACRASTRCLRRAASARRRSSARNVAG